MRIRHAASHVAASLNIFGQIGMRRRPASYQLNNTPDRIVQVVQVSVCQSIQIAHLVPVCRLGGLSVEEVMEGS